jgi:hypothetical protein
MARGTNRRFNDLTLNSAEPEPRRK